MSVRRSREEDPLVLLDREVGLRGTMFEFVQMAWPIVEPDVPFFSGWSVEAQCDHYQALEEGAFDWLLINVPPGMSKSRLNGVFWPVWSWLRDPSLRFGHFSFDGDLTLRSTRDSLALVRSPWFQARWGDLVQVPERDPAAGSWYNQRGGWRFASSVGGKATGNHFNRQGIDDPIKPKDTTPVMLAEAKRWLYSTMPTRWMNGKRKARAVVMQRLHEDDTSAQLLSERDLKEGLDGKMEEVPRYVHLMLPMEYDPKRHCYIEQTGFSDPRTKEGELLAPDFITASDVRVLKDTLGADAAGQLQQEPVAKGGALFKEWNVRYWVADGLSAEHLEREQVLNGELDEYVKRVWCRLPSRFHKMWQSWDFAFKDLETSDYVVGQVWGQVGPDYYLLWRFRDKIDFNKSVEMVKVVSKKFPKAIAKLVEDKANGTAVMNALKGRVSGLTPVDPEGGKEARASAVSPLHAAGNVWYPDPRMAGFEWVTQHVNEMTKFPRGKYDDSVDAETQALNWASTGFKAFTQAMANVRDQGMTGRRLRNLLGRMGR